MKHITDDEHEKNLKNFETKKWHNLNYEKRLDALQKLEDKMAQEQGRDAREISPVKLEKNTTGYFDSHYPSYIHINEDCLSSKHDSPSASYDAMDTIIHEGRHAYQYDVIHNKTVKDPPNRETARQWKENALIKYQSHEDYFKYRFQSKEDDAYNYSREKIKSYEEHFKNDKQHQRYIVKESIKEKRLEAKAQKRISKNFREEINDKISDRCREREKQSPEILTPISMDERSKDIESLREENIHKLQDTYISTNKQLTAIQQESALVKQEIQHIDYTANEMERHLKEVKSKEGRPDKHKQAVNTFKRIHKIEPEKAEIAIKELRERAETKKCELKPTEDKINGLSEERDKILKNYKEQISQIAVHKDGQAVLARFELSRKDENVDTRDITELKEIERNVLYTSHDKPRNIY